VTLEHTPLDPGTLGPEAQRALASPASRMMAARGLAPIPSPRDLLSVLYQLALDGDARLRTAAEASAAGLPEGILRGGLADPAQDARALDWWSRRLGGDSPLVEVVAENPATHALTIAWMAGSGGARLCDLIAVNETRLLAHPEIVAALYGNRAARMSTVDRVMELAVRNGVKVAGIAAWDELVAAYAGAARGAASASASGPASAGEIVEVEAAAMDAAFARAVEAGEAGAAGAAPPAPEKELEVWQLPVPMKIRLATLGNAFDRAILIRDPKKMVSVAVIKAPGVTEIEATKYAANTGLAEEVISFIANKREWTKLYGIKLSLVNNPKCPLAHSMRLLPHLREKDVQAVARSKSIPSALAAQARKLIAARTSGGSKGGG
jgi:hypothetical protein